MRKSLLILLFITLLCFFSLRGAAEKANMGCGGSVWVKLSERDEEIEQLVKIVLVRGIYEGAWFTDSEKTKKRFYNNIKYSSLANALDDFYSDSYNIKIPIYYALEVVSMKYKGASSKDIEKRIKQLRFEWANKASACAYLVK